ncbi:hypothetical protein QFC19_003987 [Naganishia cerealis]|uniref:Uncharacterized protein n=1 Tax=Naganishia cerealis TaxID=610337 RepID=A0ACC2VZ16_9TREE|nr:hypothetical protein QFC19_003987 [Naganishia cerealis]
MSPFSSIATVASNTFGDDPVAGFSADQLLDFPMCSAAANDGGFPGTSFSPFALTAPFPEFTDAQDHGAQSTLMQSHRDPQMTAPMLSMSADVDIAALLRQYDKGSVTDPVKSSVPPAVVEPLVAVKQEPMDDVLMSVNDIPATRSSGISPAALFGSTAAPIINRPTGTASNSAQDFFPLHPTLHRSASSASVSASASEEEDDAHEAVTPDPFAGSKDHQVDVVTAASTGGSRKSSVVATPAITGKRGRATDSDSVNDKVKVKGKTSNTPPIDFASYAREPTPVRELTAMDVLDDTDGGGFDGSSSSRINIDTLKPLPLPSMFGGIKGKGGKKGGGLSSVVLEDPAEAGEDDDWRPTPEEYKKLSSKEKRQLRNKLSARAFRTRRKTYINELEDHIKDRDRLIDAIKGELMTSRSENDELK